jgi:hypothetical protein
VEQNESCRLRARCKQMGIIESQLLSFRAEFSYSSMQVVTLVVKHLPNDDVYCLALFRSIPKTPARHAFHDERKRTDINWLVKPR